MQLWFSRTSEVSIREQLATQVVLGIVSGELAPGQRLPSTRELARRFHLHPNTISATYRQLQHGKWVEFRKGSGIYVGKQTPAIPPHNGLALDQLIANFFRSARRLNSPLAQVRSRLRQWLELQPPDHFLLIEPDEQLAQIISAEIRTVVAVPVRSCTPGEYRQQADGAVPMTVSFTEKFLRDVLPPHLDLVVLQLRSAGESLASHLPASITALVGIASAWQPFLKNARTMLIAAGFDPNSLVLRDASRPNWRRGLKQTAVTICDTLTAKQLNGNCRTITFPLLADSSLQELREHQRFIQDPLGP